MAAPKKRDERHHDHPHLYTNGPHADVRWFLILMAAMFLAACVMGWTR